MYIAICDQGAPELLQRLSCILFGTDLVDAVNEPFICVKERIVIIIIEHIDPRHRAHHA